VTSHFVDPEVKLPVRVEIGTKILLRDQGFHVGEIICQFVCGLASALPCRLMRSQSLELAAHGRQILKRLRGGERNDRRVARAALQYAEADEPGNRVAHWRD